MARKLQPDNILFGTVILLVLFGTLMVFSASAVMATERYGHSYYFVIRQGIAAILGLGAMVWLMNGDYRRLASSPVVFPAVTLQLMLLAGVLLARRTHNAHRWIHLGMFSFEPSEVSKIVLVVFLAYFLSSRRHAVNDVRHTLAPVALVAATMILLVLSEPDLGTSLALSLIVVTMLLVAGLSWKYILGPLCAVSPILYWLVVHVGYRYNRLLAFLHPDQDPLGKGFQIIQSTIAVATGGLDGVGLMNGRQKLFFLPEPHNDFIFAVVSEEFGWLGDLAVLTLFAVILWRGTRAALKCQDEFGRLLAFGITMMLVGQALVNISVVVGLMPTKGIPLPFISYGGSSLVTNLVATGILLNVSQQADG